MHSCTNQHKEFNPQKIDHILRLEEVKELTQKSKSSIYSDIAQNLFPAPFKIGSRAVGWKQSQISEWLDNLKPAQEHIA
jgi:prophage regulatory protein